MSCKICGRGSCASWMHSAEQQEAWSLVESMDDRQLRSEVVDLRGEVVALKAEIADEAIALRDMMSERDAADAELKRYKDAVDAQPWASDAPIRVLLDQITSELLTTRNLLMADTEVQAELAAANAKLLRNESDGYLCELERTRAELAAERARLNWILRLCETGVFYRAESRAAIDAAMKRRTK